MRRPTLVALAFAAVLMPVAAQETQRASFGAGNRSCGSWSASRRNRESASEQQWLLGYLSAVNMYAKAPLRSVDNEAVFGWVDKLCAGNPLSNLDVAVLGLTNELGATLPTVGKH
jgi:hypothetical protein